MIVDIAASGGRHTGTKFVASVLELASPNVISPFPGDWPTNGPAWTVDGDKVTCNNTDGSDRFLNVIYNIIQSAADKVTFRIKASGTVPAPASGGYSINLILTDSGGLGGTHLGDQQVNFEAGVLEDVQISVEVTPSAPAYWMYVYVFARYAVGTLTVWDGEVFQDAATKRDYGEWINDTADLYELANIPIASSGLGLESFGFYYGDLSSVDNDGSIEHGIEQLSKFQNIVIATPSVLNTARKWAVMQGVVATSTRVWGYVQVGPIAPAAAPTLAAMKGYMDECYAAGYYGIFFDNFGYDSTVTRAMQNDVIDYAHSLLMSCMGNAWLPADVLGAAVDATYNPTGVATHLTAGDWVLSESFYIRGDNQYAGVPEGGFAVSLAKYKQSVDLATPLSVKICGLSAVLSATVLSDNTDMDKAYLLAIALGYSGFSYTESLGINAIPWDTYPETAVGTILIQPLDLSDAANHMYQAVTDAGVIWFQAVDNPVSRAAGSFSTVLTALEIAQNAVILGSVPSSNADFVGGIWEISSDKSTWTEFTGKGLAISVGQRYLRYRVELRN